MKNSPQSGHKKGFFFTLIIFLLVGYILISTTLWLKTVEESERRFSEQFRTDNVESIVSQIDTAQLKAISDIVVRRSLYNLNEYSRSNPLKAGQTEEMEFLNRAMGQLVETGTADEQNFVSTSDLQTGSGGLQGWKTEFNNAISSIGLEVTSFTISNFRITQVAIDRVEYSYNLALHINDRLGTTSITRNYQVKSNVDINGFTDAALTREAKNDLPSLDIEKQYYFQNTYALPDNLAPSVIVSGNEGQGWFYGPLATTADIASIPAEKKGQYILVGTYPDITAVSTDSNFEEFGAIILTNAPTLLLPGPSDSCRAQDLTFNALTRSCGISGGLYAKPFAVLPGFDAAFAPACPDGRCVLFVSKYSPEEVINDPKRKLNGVSLYNMENARDFSVCGYYIGNVAAPSFMQRMLSDSYSRSGNYGIETFLVGSYVGGKTVGSLTAPDATYPDGLSRLDKDVVFGISGTQVRGMPGCKSKEQCNGDSPVGHFSIAQDGANRYGLNSVWCSDTRARCN